jgi:hypothetical protein
LSQESLEQLRSAITIANKRKLVFHATDNPELLSKAEQITRIQPFIKIIDRPTEERMIKLKELKDYIKKVR